MKVPAARIQFLPEDRAWIAARIEEVLASGQLTLGKYGAEFERRFAELCGRRHGIAVSSGTAALEIILRSLGVEGKDVLVPANTFFATAAAVVHAGGRPVFVDVEPVSLALAPDDAERRITPATAGMIAVHIGGTVAAGIEALEDLARRKGIWLVEDAAHAHGSLRGGRRAGSFGTAASFSFYPTKVMTSAEGGMIATDDDALAEEARIYRDQGKASFTQNSHVRMGYNWRLSEPHAIIGLRHLERLPAMIADRRRIAAYYDRALAASQDVVPLRTEPGSLSNYYKYVAMLRRGLDRKALKAELRSRHEVALAGEVYEEPLHAQPVFARYAGGALPVSEDVCARQVCLPVYSGMADEEAEAVVKALDQQIKQGERL